MNEFQNDKQAIRRAILKQRGALSPEQLQAASEAICEKVMNYLQSPAVRLPHGTVMSYASFRNELPTGRLNRMIREAGYTLILPYTDEHFRITPLIIDEQASFRTSPLGITEPDINTCRQAGPEEIDLILMPGIAFDRRGCRVGFGKGCYDQFLPAVPNSVPVMGLAYDFQLIEWVPAESHDRPADGIITPTQILLCRQLID